MFVAAGKGIAPVRLALTERGSPHRLMMTQQLHILCAECTLLPSTTSLDMHIHTRRDELIHTSHARVKYAHLHPIWHCF